MIYNLHFLYMELNSYFVHCAGFYLEILVWGGSTCKLSCRILTIQYYYAIAYILICNLQIKFLFLNFVKYDTLLSNL